MMLHARVLTDALTFVNQACDKSNFPEVHQYVMVEIINGNVLRLRATSGHGAHFAVTLGEIESNSIKSNPSGPNRMVLNPQKIIDGFSKMNEQLRLKFDFDKLALALGTGKARVKEPCMLPGEFADLIPRAVEHELPIPETLSKALRRSGWSSDPKSVRVSFQGVMFKKLEGCIEVVTSDTHVISVSSDRDNFDSITEDAIITVESAKVVSDLFELASLRAVPAIFHIAEGKVYCRVDNRYYESPILSDPIPNYTGPITHAEGLDSYEIAVRRVEFQAGLTFAGRYMDSAASAISLIFKDRTMLVTGSDSATGHKGDYKVTHSGEAFETTVHVKLKNLIGILKNLDTEEVTLKIPKKGATQILVRPTKAEGMDTVNLSALYNPETIVK